MGTQETTEALRRAAEEVLSRHDLVVEGLDVRERQGTREVTLVVDLPEQRAGSVDLDTVADASRELSELLDGDESLLGAGASVLEVTTPGVDRPLTEPRHFRRSRGRVLALDLRDGSSVRARLLEVREDDSLALRPEAGVDDRGRPRKLPKGTPATLELPFDEVDKGTVEIEFNPPADLAELTGEGTAAPGGDRPERPSSAADDSER
ncbi:ribosome assembly cofactor RimP [Brachybacterium endophyticum]|uniref:Ribosome maturation factor RimP n=1 Tax=Brachybacterium endophyticum TaxID=2182385 RepID=A0A2U2RMF1_9MICO|nr:ribosome assembly cofactor RimP [Brachybacterium endophyticum]PWH07049.1 ribosome assembly cofactor RimP [Brachybacterium endophyticum]